jgi:hypothetical protein
MFSVAPANEIAVAYFLNIGFFVFAFGCFEFFLRSATSRVRMFDEASAKAGLLLLPPRVGFPR